MKINGIDYCITLAFDDESGERIAELDFDDFDEVNRYIRENNPSCHSVGFSFREMIDGKPDSRYWEQTIEWKEFSEQDIQDEIRGHLQFLEDGKKFAEQLKKFSKELHLDFDATYTDYNKKKNRLNDFVYVCPRCLCKLENCRCKNYPYYLVQIDKQMLPIIRDLNMNGYITTDCCAGHPSTDDHMYIYIAFDKEYHFDVPFPDGGRYAKLKHILQYSPPEDMPREEYASFQERVIDELTEWADMLLPADIDD